MEVLVIVNPGARRASPALAAAVAGAWRDTAEVDTVTTTQRGEATTIAAEVAAAGGRVVLVVGGDGTVNEVAQGLAGTECALGVIPAGTTNVAARMLGTPLDQVAASAALAEAHRHGRRRRIGAGRIDGRIFLSNAGIGFDAAVVSLVERHPRLKTRLGHGWFGAAALFVAARPPVRAGGLDVEIGPTRPGGTPRRLAAAWVVLQRHRVYTYAGSRALHVARPPEASDTEASDTEASGTEASVAAASPWRPSLSLVAFERAGILSLGRRAPRLLRDGFAPDSTRVACVAELPWARVSAATDVAVQVDGDARLHRASAGPITVAYEPDALWILELGTHTARRTRS